MKKWLCSLVVLAACGGDQGEPAAAWATIEPFGGGTIAGHASFDRDTDNNADVIVDVWLDSCVEGKLYPVHIHSGASCSDVASQGGHWDMTRGEGIPPIVCSDGTGFTDYTRKATDPSLAWSIGGSPDTEVDGHTIVVHDPDNAMTRVACGTIHYLYPI